MREISMANEKFISILFLFEQFLFWSLNLLCGIALIVGCKQVCINHQKEYHNSTNA